MGKLNVATAIVSVLVVAGCSGGDTDSDTGNAGSVPDPTGTTASTATTATTASPASQLDTTSVPKSTATTVSVVAVPVAPCDLLTDDELLTLTIDEPIYLDEPSEMFFGLPACTTEIGAVNVRAGAVPATDFVDAIPRWWAIGADFIEDPALAARVEGLAARIESGETFTPEQACEVFAELQPANMVEEPNYRVNYVPAPDSPFLAEARLCRAGLFVSVELDSYSLTADQAELDRLRAAVERVHEVAAGG